MLWDYEETEAGAFLIVEGEPVQPDDEGLRNYRLVEVADDEHRLLEKWGYAIRRERDATAIHQERLAVAAAEKIIERLTRLGVVNVGDESRGERAKSLAASVVRIVLEKHARWTYPDGVDDVWWDE